ncbi:helix-turn-helix domain-containing protein [Saccharibacillus alkalitolerans]|uniref:MerR family transcriptional regulator n=1 Tax=Saccharibacillus alkalitolerans TaxID=2705290 RepID=A0ABX0F5U2_9BACL|nr:MerR family transcriptional regulator [Saccharibacillus alkalitolerans]NGZ75775.1 MerR family transcriptional regulator [Saccharibacillus alkalitolerans]
MNDFLTIREFAGMMGVSVHQVRYFEEKGLLPPAHIDSGGYRRYGIEEMYRLSHILLLRQLDIPVAEARRAIDEYDGRQSERLIEDSLASVRAEIERLRRLERFASNLLAERREQKERPDAGSWERRPSRRLRRWAMPAGPEQSVTARMLLEAPARPRRLFEADLFHVRDEGGTGLYFRLEPEEDGRPDDLLLEAGLYWSESFAAAGDEEAEAYVEAACARVRGRFGLSPERIVLAEKSYLSLFGGSAVQLELEIYAGPAEEIRHDR